jgi:hypothetical protein
MINPMPVNITHEHRVAVLSRKVIPQVNKRAAMSVAPSHLQRFLRLAAHSIGLTTGIMQMIRTGCDAVVGVHARRAISPGFVMGSLNHMK